MYIVQCTCGIVNCTIVHVKVKIAQSFFEAILQSDYATSAADKGDLGFQPSWSLSQVSTWEDKHYNPETSKWTVLESCSILF